MNYKLVPMDKSHLDAVAALDQRVGRIEQMLTAQAQPKQRQKNEEAGA